LQRDRRRFVTEYQALINDRNGIYPASAARGQTKHRADYPPNLGETKRRAGHQRRRLAWTDRPPTSSRPAASGARPNLTYGW